MRVPVLPVLFALLLLTASSCTNETHMAQPSILLVVIDTLRADAVSAYGSVEGTTPTLDALAASGELYSHAYAPAPWTLPSHASLFTGTSVDVHGIGVGGQVVLAQEATTLAERLRAAGYQTAGFSENALISDVFGFEQGFDHFAVRTIEEQMAANEKLVIDVAAELANWLQARDPDRPFFVFINLYDPHEPYEVRDENPFLPDGAMVASARRSQLGQRTSHRICARLPAESQLEIMRRLYLGEVARADRKLGQALTLLRDHATSDLVTVVTSDHGEHFGERRLLDHEFSVHDVVLRVPLVVHGRAAEPATIEKPVELRDITRSLLEWAEADSTGVTAHGLVDENSEARGEPPSLFSLYSDTRMQLPESFDSGAAQQVRDAKRESCSDSDPVFGDMVAVTRFPFKLNWYERYPSELFDLSEDPRERSDQRSSHPELFSILEEQAVEFAARSRLAGLEANQAMPAQAKEALRSLGYLD